MSWSFDTVKESRQRYFEIFSELYAFYSSSFPSTVGMFRGLLAALNYGTGVAFFFSVTKPIKDGTNNTTRFQIPKISSRV